MTKGRKPSSNFTKNTSMQMPRMLWGRADALRVHWGVPRSTVYRRAIAVLSANPALWDAFCEFATPEDLAEIETGKGI